MATSTFFDVKESFVYCWSDLKTNRLYIGVHKGRPDDGYICSSKHMLKEYKQRPDDFSRQIIAEGEDVLMRKFETKLLQSVHAGKNDDFYNLHQNNGKFYWKGKRGKFSESHKKKLSDAKKGKRQLKETIEKRILKNTGKKRTEETKIKMSKSQKGKKLSLEHIEKARKTRLQNCDTSKIARHAGKMSQEKRKNDQNFSKKHSERMKLWWAARKGLN